MKEPWVPMVLTTWEPILLTFSPKDPNLNVIRLKCKWTSTRGSIRRGNPTVRFGKKKQNTRGFLRHQQKRVLRDSVIVDGSEIRGKAPDMYENLQTMGHLQFTISTGLAGFLPITFYHTIDKAMYRGYQPAGL